MFHTIKGIRGSEWRISRRLLEQLRMLADWQLRERGIDPASVTAACLKAE